MNAYDLLKKKPVNKISNEDKQRALSIANTIISQIKASDPYALMAWGTSKPCPILESKKDIGYVLGGVSFKVRGAKVKRGGIVYVYLMANDTYIVRVGRLYNYKWTEIKTVQGVYCDTLMNTIDEIIER
jgi:hypothetical protein